jgi:hypothetical protein
MLWNFGPSWFKFDFESQKIVGFYRSLASTKDPLSFLSITIYRAPSLVFLNRSLLFLSRYQYSRPSHNTTNTSDSLVVQVLKSLDSRLCSLFKCLLAFEIRAASLLNWRGWAMGTGIEIR